MSVAAAATATAMTLETGPSSWTVHRSTQLVDTTVGADAATAANAAAAGAAAAIICHSSNRL